MKCEKPKHPVNIEYVNHGKAFGNENWFTFYCGNCKSQVYGDQKQCEICAAILQDKKAYTE